jgi:hypothetical protein
MFYLKNIIPIFLEVRYLIRSPYLICYKTSLSSAIVSIITLTLNLINIIALCSLIFKINLRFFHHKSIKSRDGNSGMSTRYPPVTQPDGYVARQSHLQVVIQSAMCPRLSGSSA